MNEHHNYVTFATGRQETLQQIEDGKLLLAIQMYSKPSI